MSGCAVLFDIGGTLWLPVRRTRGETATTRMRRLRDILNVR